VGYFTVFCVIKIQGSGQKQAGKKAFGALSVFSFTRTYHSIVQLNLSMLLNEKCWNSTLFVKCYKECPEKIANTPNAETKTEKKDPAGL
jgi:hypothetical protein